MFSQKLQIIYAYQSINLNSRFIFWNWN